MLTFVSYASELNLDKVLDNVIKSYGGEKPLKQLNKYAQVWKIKTSMGSVGQEERKVIIPDALSIELTYPSRHEIRLLNKDYGTKETQGVTKAAKGALLDAMKLQLMRIYSPLVLKNHKSDLALIDTKEYYKIEFIKGSITSYYFVNKKTFMIDKVIGELSQGENKMSFRTLYSNYQDVNGVMIAHNEEKFAAQTPTAKLSLKKVTFY